MISGQVAHFIEAPEVRKALAELGTRYPMNMQGRTLQAAAHSLLNGMKKLIHDIGLMNISDPKSAPISSVIVMRSLVMLRELYKFEITAPGEDISRIGENLFVLAPNQSDLTGDDKKVGLIQSGYVGLGLDRLGFSAEDACGGAPHVQESAHFLADAGLLIERGVVDFALVSEYMVTFDRVNNLLAELHKTPRKQAQAPYALRPEGRILAYYLFGDDGHVINSSIRGWTGVPQVDSAATKHYSPWLEFLDLDKIPSY